MTNMEWQSVKLIIWDLDETFWKGTISEGKVSKIQKNINFILDSTDMGIVHSICSKKRCNSSQTKTPRMGDMGLFCFSIR